MDIRGWEGEQVPQVTRGSDRRQGQIGERVRKLRVDADMTQQELADFLGVTREWVSAVEVGRIGLTVRRLDQVARALHRHQSDFLAPRRELRETEKDLVTLWRDLNKPQQDLVLKIMQSLANANARAPRQRAPRRSA